jgi:hypothetical protein
MPSCAVWKLVIEVFFVTTKLWNSIHHIVETSMEISMMIVSILRELVKA